MRYQTSGTIISSEQAGQDPGWFFVSVDQEIGRYYRWFYTRGLAPPWYSPLNGPHVTFVFGRHEPRLVTVAEMKPFLGTTVEFFYDAPIYTNTRAFWMKAHAPVVLLIRRRLGLKEPHRPLHLTLGTRKT
jgi:hypothetical protein